MESKRHHSHDQKIRIAEGMATFFLIFYRKFFMGCRLYPEINIRLGFAKMCYI
ncbi:MAG: hypothetical protein QRY71_04580 [Candidatus Rhabdochlamydia sp.]